MSDPGRSLRLLIRTPARTVIDEEVRRLTAEDASGRFGLRPGGEPLLAALVPGLLSYHRLDGSEVFVAVGRGVLNAGPSDVQVAVREAFPCGALEDLEESIERAARVRYEAENALKDVFRSVHEDLLMALVDEERRP